jgi:hypothetical protein
MGRDRYILILNFLALLPDYWQFARKPLKKEA